MSRIPLRSSFPNPLGDSSREPRKPLVSFDDVLIYLMILPISLAAMFHLLNAPKVSEAPKTRDIHLTVPQESSVNAEVTSGNTTVHLEDI